MGGRVKYRTYKRDWGSNSLTIIPVFNVFTTTLRDSDSITFDQNVVYTNIIRMQGICKDWYEDERFISQCWVLFLKICIVIFSFFAFYLIFIFSNTYACIIQNVLILAPQKRAEESEITWKCYPFSVCVLMSGFLVPIFQAACSFVR